MAGKITNNVREKVKPIIQQNNVFFISRVWLRKIYIKHKSYIGLGCYLCVSVVYFHLAAYVAVFVPHTTFFVIGMSSKDILLLFKVLKLSSDHEIFSSVIHVTY